MKRTLLLLVFSLALGACALPSQPTSTPTATELVFVLATDTPTVPVTPTDTPIPTNTPEPTETPAPSETPLPSETPTFTPTPTPESFDPRNEYGSIPTRYDSMDDDRYWASPGGGLPDTEFIRLALGSGMLHVTGKQANFDTWWFTVPTPNNVFVEMTVNTGSCGGKQEYGFILRGPETTGVGARGYIYTFSCDGSYRLDRLDSTSPWVKPQLIGWTQSDFIKPGSEQTNVIGVRMVGDTITLYANRQQVAEIQDSQYPAGRFGLFVNADTQGNYTYRVDELAYWRLD